MRFMKWLVILLFLPMLALPVQAAKRIALVIGINDYAEVPKLEKAVGDAEAIAQVLGQIGFDVTTAFNLDRRTLNVTLAQFYEKIEPGDTVLFHYSGHGVQLENDNYLLPTDIPAPNDGNAELVKSESLRLLTVVETLAAKGAGARVIIVDACRNNPFEQAGKRSIGGTRGLASVSPAKGDFVMFSAGAGQAALDRLNENDPVQTSVFTRVLLTRLTTPGMKLRDIAASVKEEVEGMGQSVGHAQRPAYYDDLPESFSLLPGNSSPPPVDNTPLTPPEELFKPENVLSEEAAYKLADGINTMDGWNAFITQYPDGAYTPYAKAQREKLVAITIQKEEPPPTPKPKPKPPKKQQAASCSAEGRVTGLNVEGDNFLSVRTGPGTGFTEIDRIYNGDRVSICSRQGRWLRVNYGNGKGWVSGKYIAE
jgi:hypothetical protein